MTQHEEKSVRPLGVFGSRANRPWELSKQQLSDLKETLDSETRRRVADYLSEGTLIIALMKYTTDVLGGAFGVSGGSGIMSDGTYYWRRDAAAYVLEYGIDVGEEALHHMRANNWTPPGLSQNDALEIDRYLAKALRNRDDDVVGTRRISGDQSADGALASMQRQDAVSTGATNSYSFEIPDQRGTQRAIPATPPRSPPWIDNRGFLDKPADPVSGLDRRVAGGSLTPRLSQNRA